MWYICARLKDEASPYFEHINVPYKSKPQCCPEPQKKGLRRQVVISDIPDVEVQVCTAHNALIISQPDRLDINLHLIPDPFYFPEQYGSEVFKRIACVDAQPHSSEAAALKTRRRAGSELKNTHIPRDSQPEVVKARSVKYAWGSVESSITLSTFKISKGLLWFHIHRLTLQTLIINTVKLLHRILHVSPNFQCVIKNTLACRFSNLQTSISLPCHMTLCSGIHKTHYFLHFCNLHSQYSLWHLALDYGNLDQGIRAFHSRWFFKSNSCSFS